MFKYALSIFVLTFNSFQAIYSQPVPSPTMYDDDLLEKVQKQTFNYFWDFAHPVSGLARERSNTTFGYGDEVTTTGGSGFGIMAMITGAERKWVTREAARDRMLKIVNFLLKAVRYHGIFPHWLNGETGKTIPFSQKDDGADLVETSFLFQGLLTARQYFNLDTPREKELRNLINSLWKDAEWNWHTRGGLDLLYWHWSPNYGWSMNFELRGWNECLITYILAASSPDYSIPASVYHKCWAEAIILKMDGPITALISHLVLTTAGLCFSRIIPSLASIHMV